MWLVIISSCYNEEVCLHFTTLGHIVDTAAGSGVETHRQMVYSRYFTKIHVRYLIGIWKLHTAECTCVKQTTQLTEALKHNSKVRQSHRSNLVGV